MISSGDTVVLAGDHSWGRNLKEAEADLEFIASLPGRKILLRGNHDMFWDAGRTKRLNEKYNGRLFFLQNNFYSYGNTALVGTKGYCYEGKDSPEHFEKLVKRELERLRLSYELAVAAGYTSFIQFLHYPPTSIGEEGKRFYPDGAGIWGRSGDLRSLPWERPLSGQFSGKCRRGELPSGVL